MKGEEAEGRTFFRAKVMLYLDQQYMQQISRE